MYNNFADYPTDPNAYLMHYGVKGMRWYHRRYQNSNGSLTEAGRRRMGRIEKSKFRSKLQQKSATSWADYGRRQAYKQTADAKKYAEYHAGASKAYKNKAAQYKEQGNIKKSNKYNKKAQKHFERFVDYGNQHKDSLNSFNERNQLYNDLVNGKLKAGRDFMITQGSPWYGNSNDYYMITKKKGSKKLASYGKTYVY